jgi:molybdenum cofactor guanylyltransferase
LLSQPTLTAIILAGGLSSRMGQDKALIAIDGVPLLLRVAEVARQMADQVYVVTAWVERYRDLCAEADILLIPEPQADVPQGPLCGFLQGLAQVQFARVQSAQVQPDWVLLLACDLPNLRVEVLQAWRTLLATAPPDVMALLPQSENHPENHPENHSGGRWEPLCGFYRWQCQTSLQAFAQTGGRSFQRWLNQQSVQPLPAHDPAMLFNCNTPADLQQINFL